MFNPADVSKPEAICSPMIGDCGARPNMSGERGFARVTFLERRQSSTRSPSRRSPSSKRCSAFSRPWSRRTLASRGEERLRVSFSAAESSNRSIRSRKLAPPKHHPWRNWASLTPSPPLQHVVERSFKFDARFASHPLLLAPISLKTRERKLTPYSLLRAPASTQSLARDWRVAFGNADCLGAGPISSTISDP